MTRRLTKLEVINKAYEVHGYKYIYDKMEYVNNSTKICIVCPIHGDFWQRPNDHLSGKGCPKCSDKTSNQKDFKNKAIEIHGEKYIYDNVVYINNYTKVSIICPEHGEFWQTPSNHLQGRGCPKCGQYKRKLKQEDLINSFNQIHKNKYVYDKMNYVNFSTKICIGCKEHGDFWQTPSDHLNGHGCPKCAKKSASEKIIKPFSQFVEDSIKIHGNKYVYDENSYVSTKHKTKIICPIHGDFWQRPNDHLTGYGCPKCNHSISNPEDEINNFINETCDIETKTRDRSLLNKRLECDIIVPSYKLAIEFNGLYWHSEAQGKDKNYHLNKTELAESKGYHLIHIFEDEWLEHKDIVLNKIKHFLGCDTDKSVIGARKCAIKTVSKTLAEPFLTTYHIQGFVGSTAYYGAFYGDILVGVMTFKQEKKGEWNLTRFATDTNYRLPGLASKIFKQFIKDCSPVEVKTFLDRRWSHGDVNVYDRMGFKLTETLAPDYRYVVKGQRLHKFGFRKQILHKKYGLPLTMTEKEMTEQLGFYRIWDCGLYKYVWRKE